jgi:hypothetical protein
MRYGSYIEFSVSILEMAGIALAGLKIHKARQQNNISD